MDAPIRDAAAPGWLPDWLSAAWDLLATYPLLLALVVAVTGLVLAGLVRALILFWGLKVTARTSTDLDEKLVRTGAGVAGLIVAYVSLVAAVGVLPLGDVPRLVGTRMLVSFLVLQLMRAALRTAGIVLTALSQMRDRFSIVEERTIPLFDLVLTVVIIAVAGYALLQVWRVDATAWLASAGVIGIAVGFAAKDTLANLFAGFFIIADAPYRVGDYVVLDSGERGEVTRVGIRSTRILTRDDVEVIVPNSVMANTKVVNESGGRWTRYRIRIKIGVAYGTDVDQVIRVLARIAATRHDVCTDPEPRVRFRAFGNSSLDFELLCWVNHPSERGLVSHHLHTDIYKAFEAEGIAIPFPQRDVWLRETPAVATRATGVKARV